MCCGNTIAATYGASGGSEQTGWIVTYPNGITETKATEIAARLAAALVPGAKYGKAGSAS
jgi:hypothetical protein